MSTALVGSPVMTNVLGYKNNNGFPLNINSDHLGINVQVGKKSYVLDRDGRMINDARLDYWAKGGLLSKEYSEQPVPLIMLGGSQVAPASPATSVAVLPRPVSPVAILPSPPVRGEINMNPTKEITAGPLTRLPVASPAGQTTLQSPVGSTSIGAMSVQEATDRGLIGKPDRRERFEKAPNESADGPTAPKGTPYIDQVAPMPRQVIPPSMRFEKAPVDLSHVNDLGSDDVVGATTASVASDAGVVLPTPRIQSRLRAALAAPVPPASGSVQLDGKTYTTPGNLKKALLKKYNGDNDLANEAFEELRSAFG